MYICVPHGYSAPSGQKGASDLLGPELHMVIRCYVGGHPNVSSLEGQPMPLTTEYLSSPSLELSIFLPCLKCQHFRSVTSTPYP